MQAPVPAAAAADDDNDGGGDDDDEEFVGAKRPAKRTNRAAVIDEDEDEEADAAPIQTAAAGADVKANKGAKLKPKAAAAKGAKDATVRPVLPRRTQHACSAHVRALRSAASDACTLGWRPPRVLDARVSAFGSAGAGLPLSKAAACCAQARADVANAHAHAGCMALAAPAGPLTVASALRGPMPCLRAAGGGR